MNLTIDIGNSRIKAAVFNNERLVANCTVQSAKELYAFIKKYSGIKTAIVSSTTDYPAGFTSLFGKKIKLTELSEKTPLPFSNAYKTPKTLGKDRIAAIAGAWHILPKKNILVVNAGTCITYDFIHKNGVYHGGAISPGLDIRFKALHTFTGRLPLIGADTTFTQLTGKTTEESILTGVQQGMTEEIQGFIRAYSKKYSGLQVIITGGSHSWLKTRLSGKIISEPFLTLKGLNVLLPFNITGKTSKHKSRA